jgi:hypothetical protein
MARGGTHPPATHERATSVIRSFLRFLAFLLLAAGFVAAVMDAARSLANSSLTLARLEGTVVRLLGERALTLQPLIERNIHPLLWDPVMTTLLLAPTSLMLLAMGLVLHWLGRPAQRAPGHLTRS